MHPAHKWNTKLLSVCTVHRTAIDKLIRTSTTNAHFNVDNETIQGKHL